jgi:hypothetical protein
MAREGKYHPLYRVMPDLHAMHRLAIAYGKIRKHVQQATARPRSEIDLVFPELHSVLRLDSLTARHLLHRHLFPEDYLSMDLHAEAAAISEISPRPL